LLSFDLVSGKDDHWLVVQRGGQDMALIDLVKGFPGKPSHPPLTDVSIGAYTAGAVMLLLGAAGVEERQMAHGSFLAISGGLLVGAPTAVTGLLDWLDLPKGTPVRKMATIHLFAMVGATVLFAVTWLAQRDGYRDGVVSSGATVLGLVDLAVLAVGGYVGGTLAFVYGVRVLKRSDASVTDALVPGRAGSEPSGEIRPADPVTRGGTS
jgi:uncharacterized membrane protein